MGQTIVQNPTWDVSLKTMEKKKRILFVVLLMLWPCFLFLDFTKARVSFPPAKVFHARDAATPPSLALLKWVYPSFWVPQRNIGLVGHGVTSIFSSPKLAMNWGNPPSYGQTPACSGNFTSRVSVQSFQNCIFFRKFEGSNVYQHINVCRVVEFSFFFLAFFFSFLSLIRCLVAVGYHAVAGWSCYVLLLLGHRNGAWVSLSDDGEP